MMYILYFQVDYNFGIVLISSDRIMNNINYPIVYCSTETVSTSTHLTIKHIGMYSKSHWNNEPQFNICSQRFLKGIWIINITKYLTFPRLPTNFTSWFSSKAMRTQRIINSSAVIKQFAKTVIFIESEVIAIGSLLAIDLTFRIRCGSKAV